MYFAKVGCFLMQFLGSVAMNFEKWDRFLDVIA